jgi:hypothetical protein
MAAFGGPQAIATIGLAASAFLALVAAVAVIGGAMYAFKHNLSGMGTIFTAQMTQLWASLKQLWTASRPLVDLFAELAGRFIVGMVFQLNALVAGFKKFVDFLLQDPVLGYMLGQFGISAAGIAARDAAEARQEQGEEIAQGHMETAAAAVERNQQLADRARIEEMMGAGTRGAPVVDARGSTFNIKQDFRDQDPDRIAVIFSEDLNRHAEARIRSRSSTPFGA